VYVGKRCGGGGCFVGLFCGVVLVRVLLIDSRVISVYLFVWELLCNYIIVFKCTIPCYHILYCN
jgi:hypothetical protein